MKSLISPVCGSGACRTALLAAAMAIHVGAAEAARKPNILWIVAENMGPDLGCYGYPTVVTPHLDRLAREGLRYRLAFDTAPVCSTSRSCFMTGMYQTTIGAHHHRSRRFPGLDSGYRLPCGVRPLPQRLRDAGYFTANIATLAGKRVGTGKTDLNFEVEGEVLRPDESFPANAPVETVQHNFRNSVRLFQATEWTQLLLHLPFYAQVNLPNVELGDDQRILRELRRTLEQWIVETDDQGRHAESPEVVSLWRELSERSFPSSGASGRPQRAKSKGPDR